MTDNNWVISPEKRPSAALKLFCFPYAGGSPSAFRNWGEALDAEIEVSWIQLPGRGSRLREKPFDAMAELAPALAAGIAPLLDRQFAFYGHSIP
jgi:medium-chain acyl-[acyl-carrier-protein] hydrolase